MEEDMDRISQQLRQNSVLSLNFEHSAVRRSIRKKKTGQRVFENYGGRVGFAVLCQGLLQNSSLTHLDLSWSNLDSSAAKQLAAYLLSTQHLATLNLSQNKLGASGAKIVADCLQHSKSIETLDISGNAILDQGATAVASALCCNTTLTSLDISAANIYVQGARKIFEMLAVNTTLKELHMARNVSFDAVQALVEVLPANRTLTSLDLSSNFLYGDGAKELAKGLSENLGLQELHLSENEIGDAGAKALASALKLNSTLRALMLHDNLITFIGARALAKTLGKNTSLTTLQLCENDVETKGMEALSKALVANQTLSTLHVASAGIRGPGVRHLASVLKANQWLTELNLDRNRFGLPGAKIIGRTLALNHGLRELRMAHNKIGDEGARHIANGIQNNRTLLRLDLSYNRIREGRDDLWSALNANFSLLALILDGNNLSPAARQEVEEYLLRNTRQRVLQQKISLLMAFHPRVGEASLLNRIFKESPIADKQVFKCVWDLLWPPVLQPLAGASDAWGSDAAIRDNEVQSIKEARLESQVSFAGLPAGPGGPALARDSASTDPSSESPGGGPPVRSRVGPLNTERFRAFFSGLGLSSPSEPAVLDSAQNTSSPLKVIHGDRDAAADGSFKHNLPANIIDSAAASYEAFVSAEEEMEQDFLTARDPAVPRRRRGGGGVSSDDDPERQEQPDAAPGGHAFADDSSDVELHLAPEHGESKQLETVPDRFQDQSSDGDDPHTVGFMGHIQSPNQAVLIMPNRYADSPLSVFNPASPPAASPASASASSQRRARSNASPVPAPLKHLTSLFRLHSDAEEKDGT